MVYFLILASLYENKKRRRMSKSKVKKSNTMNILFIKKQTITPFLDDVAHRLLLIFNKQNKATTKQHYTVTYSIELCIPQSRLNISLYWAFGVLESEYYYIYYGNNICTTFWYYLFAVQYLCLQVSYQY